MLKREVKAILFDMDGTLANSLMAWYFTYNDSLKEFGFKKISNGEFVKRFGNPIEKDIKDKFIGKNVIEVKSAFNRNFSKRLKLVKLMPGAELTLKELRKRNIKLALITGSTRKITSGILKKFNLKKYFGCILGMEDVKRRKPAPDMVLKACRLLKVKPQNAIIVGDTMNDITAGKRAKCVTVGYKIKGDYIIEKLKDILRIN